MALPKLKPHSKIANYIETATGSDSFIGQAKKTATDQLSGFDQDFFSQLLQMDYGEKSSGKSKQMKGDMRPGESISLRELSVSARMKPERKPDILPGIDYRREIVQGSERLSRKEAKEMDQRIQQVMDELKKLVDSSSVLKMEFAEVSVQQAPAKAGKYYVHFFEWLLIEIRKIRSQVENSGAWLNVMKSKKSGRKYGAMAKKHGTSFTLSNERTAATQTG